MRGRYEAQLSAVDVKLVSLAHAVQRMQSTGTWPGGAPAELGGDYDEGAEELDSAAAYELVAGALEAMEQAVGVGLNAPGG